MDNNLYAVSSPVFPIDKDLHISEDTESLTHSNTIRLFIQLAEPIIFLQGFEAHQWNESPPSLLRGSLIVRILKPTKLKSISLKFRGVSKTQWPEGIPPKKQEYIEVKDIINHTWPFFQHDLYPVSNNLSTDADDLLKGSNASVYLPLKTAGSNTPFNNLNRNLSSKSIINKGSIINTLSPINSILKRIHTPEPSKSLLSSKSNTNLISDFFANTLLISNDSNTLKKSTSQSGCEPFIFQPGDYVYSFEQPIPLSYPETIKATFGSVEYFLDIDIERIGAFKSNIHTRFPVQFVRTPSANSVQETEPITISRDWESQLHYDIVIASKDIVLDAFLPITFRATPLDKVQLHRIRIYLTETLEYYCKSKKVYRIEPNKKYLLVEHKAPLLEGLAQDKNTFKVKNLGNLLADDNGDIVSKEFEYHVYIPEKLNHQYRIHPNTTWGDIKSNHWIKICLRLSKMVDDKRKHYEISIDSPIHVLHKLCSHANTLLPSYDTHAAISNIDNSNYGTTSMNLYHNSNLYFPKEVVTSPMLSPAVTSMEERAGTITKSLTHLGHTISVRNKSELKLHDEINLDDVLNLPRLVSNIYQPNYLQPSLTAPQALPLSPMISPLIKCNHLQRNPNSEPPPFEHNISSLNLSEIMNNDLLGLPPTYEDVLKINNNSKENFSQGASAIERIDVSSDVVSIKSSQRSVPTCQSAIGNKLGSDDYISKDFTSFELTKHDTLSGNPLSKTKDTDKVLNNLEGIPGDDHKQKSSVCSDSSFINESRRTSVGTVHSYLDSRDDLTSMQPLLHSITERRTSDSVNTFFQSRESITQYIPQDSLSVDITALYPQNIQGWNPLDENMRIPSIKLTHHSIGNNNENYASEDFTNTIYSNEELSQLENNIKD